MQRLDSHKISHFKELKSFQNYALLKDTPGVKAIRPVKIVSIAKYVSFHILNRRWNPFHCRFARHEMLNRADPKPVPDVFPPHILGVCALHTFCITYSTLCTGRR
jgi:hypothetical protein